MKIQPKDEFLFAVPRSAMLQILGTARTISGRRWRREFVIIEAVPQEPGWGLGKGGIVLTVSFGFVIAWTAKIYVSGSVKDDRQRLKVGLPNILTAIANCEAEADIVSFVYAGTEDDAPIGIRDGMPEPTTCWAIAGKDN